MSYTSAVDHLYALGHELAPPTTARRAPPQVRPRPHARPHGRARRPADHLPLRPHRRNQRQGLHRRHARQHPHRRRLPHRPLHLAAPRPRQRAHPDRRRRRSPTKTSPASTSRSTTPPTASSPQAPCPHHPSFFEVLTALAFLYFAEQKIDIAVLEVGLGGRLDATNIVDPLLSIITDIALDHQDYLGNTIAEITREKAGILRPNGTLITLPQHPEANQAIGEAAATLNLTAISAAPFIPPTRSPTPSRHLDRSRSNHVISPPKRSEQTRRPPKHHRPSPPQPLHPHPRQPTPRSRLPAPRPAPAAQHRPGHRRRHRIT